MKLKTKLLGLIILITSLLASIWLYRDSFLSYFFQDDWFSFRISNAGNLTEFLGFFVPRTDVIYFRPLGMQLPFFLINKLFGINPLTFRIVTMITHAINVILVCILSRCITKNTFISLFVAFLYSTSLVHYIPMYWSATYSFVLGPTFFFLTFITYLKRNYLISYICFTIGILVNEIVIVTPLILWLYNFFSKEKERSRYLFLLSFTAFIFLLLRILLFPVPTFGDYDLLAGKHILTNLQAYLLWSFNWPEEMKAQFINFYTVNPEFIRDFPRYYLVFIISLMINIVLLYIIPLFSRKFVFYKRNLSIFAFTFLWFFIGLMPVLLFPKHSFAYYLPISLTGLLILSSQLLYYLLSSIRNKFQLAAYPIILIILFSWYYASAVGVDFNTLIHWAPRRAKIAEKLIAEVKARQDNNEENVLYLRNLPEFKLALNNQDAMIVITGRRDFKTVYTGNLQ